MKIDIIISNGRNTQDANPRSVRLKEEDWVYVCNICNTWEVFPIKTIQSQLICWSCNHRYERYLPSC